METEHQVRQQLTNMMGIAALRPMDITMMERSTLKERKKRTTTTTTAIPIVPTPQSTAKLNEASRLRREADILSWKAQQSFNMSGMPTSSLNNAKNAVDNYADFTQSREKEKKKLLKENQHTEKLISLRSRIAALDRSLDRSGVRRRIEHF